jgi:hypothetical protein
VFDGPRHATFLKLPVNYPRLNAWPEWYVVADGTRYQVEDGETGARSIINAEDLRDGLPVAMVAGTEQVMRVCPTIGSAY